MGGALLVVDVYDARRSYYSIRVSIIAALNNGKIIAPAIFNGYCDGNVFTTYIQDFRTSC